MIAERMPSASEQQALYSTVFTEAGDRPVTFALDIGGDKILPYMQSVEEENPALGWRAIRIGLDRRACCAPKSAPFSRPPPDASQDHVPDGGDLRRVRARQTYCGARRLTLPTTAIPYRRT